MTIIITLVYCVLTLLFFGSIRMLDFKKKELAQFLVMYLLITLLMLCLSFTYMLVSTGVSWHYPFRHTSELLIPFIYYSPPTFLIAYLLYPFKIIKRSRILIWILLVYTSIVVVGGALLSIYVELFSDM